MLVQFGPRPEASPSHARAKAFARELLDNPRSATKRWFDLGMTVLVLVSVGLLVYSVENPVSLWMIWFEQLAVTIFIAEYLARVWIVGDLHKVILDHYWEAIYLHLPFNFGRGLPTWPAKTGLCQQAAGDSPEPPANPAAARVPVVRGAAPNLHAAGTDKVIENREISSLHIRDILTRPVQTAASISSTVRRPGTRAPVLATCCW